MYVWAENSWRKYAFNFLYPECILWISCKAQVWKFRRWWFLEEISHLFKTSTALWEVLPVIFGIIYFILRKFHKLAKIWPWIPREFMNIVLLFTLIVLLFVFLCTYVILVLRSWKVSFSISLHYDWYLCVCLARFSSLATTLWRCRCPCLQQTGNDSAKDCKKARKSPKALL